LALASDADLLVRAAALEAAAGLDDTALAAAAADGIADPAWQVRTGAARGLAGAPANLAAPHLLTALGDDHLDVRKAAVIALRGFTDRADVRDGLEAATKDVDADVRGYARRILAGRGPA
ncbi:MAG TPA: HEAT repeat domain-containing protein, partial [Nocardioides sp.]|nr:HEAT repeat domain-containing protein [Nocardioides sp.]